jgi:hypothetical protein
MQLPNTFLVRANEVRTFLGISNEALQKLIAAGVLTPRQLHPRQGWRYFARHEVLEVTISTTHGSESSEQSSPTKCPTQP